MQLLGAKGRGHFEGTATSQDYQQSLGPQCDVELKFSIIYIGYTDDRVN